MSDATDISEVKKILPAHLNKKWQKPLTFQNFNEPFQTDIKKNLKCLKNMWFLQSEDKLSTFQSTQEDNQFWNQFFNIIQDLPFMTQGKTPDFLNWKVKGLTSDESAHVAHPFFSNSESSLKKPLKMNWKKKWKQSL